MSSSSGSTQRYINTLSGSEDCEFDDNYRKKRERNNLAVRLSRLRSKQRRQLTNARVRDFRKETIKLEESIKILTTDLNLLKQIFLDQATAKSDRITTEQLKSLLENPDNSDNMYDNDDNIDEINDDNIINAIEAVGNNTNNVVNRIELDNDIDDNEGDTDNETVLIE